MESTRLPTERVSRDLIKLISGYRTRITVHGTFILFLVLSYVFPLLLLLLLSVCTLLIRSHDPFVSPVLSCPCEPARKGEAQDSIRDWLVRAIVRGLRLSPEHEEIQEEERQRKRSFQREETEREGRKEWNMGDGWERVGRGKHLPCVLSSRSRIHWYASDARILPRFTRSQRSVKTLSISIAWLDASTRRVTESASFLK